MIVRRIRIEGWRAFRSGLEIADLDPRCSVIHAPNGTGKSTLLEALRRGLLDNHRARGQDVEHLRPWGTKLAPCVTIDFAHEGCEYRLRKRFLEEAGAELSRHDGQRYQPIASGDEATHRIRAILRAEPPSRSLGDWRHAGLAQLLWAPQDGLALAALAPGVVAEIQQRLGVELQQSSAPWEERLETEYGRHFTETGRPRSGKHAPPYVHAERQLEELAARRETLAAAWRDFHEASAEIDRLRRDRTSLEEQATQWELRIRAARAAAERSQELRRCCAECETRRAEAQRAYDQVHERRTNTQRLRAARESAAALREEAAAREAAQRAEGETLAERLRDAEAQLESKKAAARAADAAEARWARAERYRALVEEQRSLLSRLERLNQAEAERAQAEATCRDHPSPGSDDVARLRKALDAHQRAEAQLEVASVRVTIEPIRDGLIETRGAEVHGHALQAGRPLELHAVGELQLDWKDVGRLRISPPAEALLAARQASDRAQRELAEIESRLGTRDWAVVAQRQREAELRAARLAQARVDAERAAEGRPRPAWEAALAENATALAELISAEPLWGQAPPDAAALREQAAAAAAHRRALDEALAERDERLARFHEVRRAEQAAAAERQRAEHELRRIAEELSRLASDPPVDDAGLRQLAMAAHLAEAQLEAARRALADLPADPLREVEQAEQVQASLAQRRERNLAELSGAEQRLRMRMEQSPYAELAGVEEQMAELQLEVEAGRREAAALRLLYDTYHDCRRDFSQRIGHIVEAAARRNLTEIFGVDFGSLHIGEDLAPCAVRPEILAADEDGRLPLERLSGGEQEQVHFAVRLALAESLAFYERQLLVLDDALTATDPPRMARILRMLERAGERLQIVILTCHPERYRPLRGARWIDLDAARRDDPPCAPREPSAAELARTTG